VLTGLYDAADKVGYELTLSAVTPRRDERTAFAGLLQDVCAALILLGPLSPTAELAALADRMPVVSMFRAVRHRAVDVVRSDDSQGLHLAVGHLVELGHRRIAHITGDPAHADAAEREHGYRLALQDAGIPFEPELVVPGNFLEASGLMALNQLVEARQDFTAIFAANDQMAIGAALGAYRKSLRVPDDISLVGFDDLSGAQYFIPPLTTVRQPVYELGRLSALAVLALLRGSTPQVELPPPQLVVRESTRRLRR